MKTNVKRLLSAVLSLVMLVAVMGVPALAANSDHTYDAYQIMEGTLGTNGELGNIVWGAGVNGDALLNDLKSISAFSSCTSAATVAKALASVTDEATMKQVSRLAYKNRSSATFTGVTNGDSLVRNNKGGYFLLVDSTDTQNVENSVKNLLILKISDRSGISIQNKVDYPEVQKKVKDCYDVTGAVTGWQDSADYDIGDHVPFQLTAKLSTIEDYDTYKVIFNDTLSAGLTYDAGTAELFVDGASKGSITPTVSGTSLTFTVPDVKALGAHNNSQVVVEYTATLNSNAILGSAGNPNKVYLQYSNNPFDSGSGNNNVGKTPEDQVIVFTYALRISKVDDSGNALTGASFKLTKQVGSNWPEVATIDGTNLSTFEWKGLDDGNYKLEETVTPDGYNTAEALEFTITATHDEEAQEPKLTNLSVSNGLTVELASGQATASYTGFVQGTVVNVIGPVLPETGGMGTTLFYVVGGLLLVGAGVVLVAKRRMDAE